MIKLCLDQYLSLLNGSNGSDQTVPKIPAIRIGTLIFTHFEDKERGEGAVAVATVNHLND